jgi:tRNA pseudouridine38-40 synthase
MPRYFIEVGYKGTAYAGFQVQQNANTIQAEIENALQVYSRKTFALTGSSRTDAGVHAMQNYFMVDVEDGIIDIAKTIYHTNAILPKDIVVKNITLVADDAHCRFDALYRSYKYTITTEKNPFLLEYAYHYPFALDVDAMNVCAKMLLDNSNFESFAKKNTQVFTHECTISKSEWTTKNNVLEYNVTGNRFLRGMVRGLVGTMLLVGRGKYSVTDFKGIIESHNASKTDFSAPAHGLTLMQVAYDETVLSLRG